MDEDIDGIPLDNSKGGFIPSKWETVDPEQVKDQAITTSKWEKLEPVAPEPPKISALMNYEDSSESEVEDDSFDSRFVKYLIKNNFFNVFDFIEILMKPDECYFVKLK